MKYPKLTPEEVAELTPFTREHSFEEQGMYIGQICVMVNHYGSSTREGDIVRILSDRSNCDLVLEVLEDDGTFREVETEYPWKNYLAPYPTDKIKPTRKVKSMTPATDKAAKTELTKLEGQVETLDSQIEKKNAQKAKKEADIVRLKTFLGV